MLWNRKRRRVAIDLSPKTQRRVRQLDIPTLDVTMESILNRSLPEAYSHWRRGLAPGDEVENALEAALGCWYRLREQEGEL